MAITNIYSSDLCVYRTYDTWGPISNGDYSSAGRVYSKSYLFDGDLSTGWAAVQRWGAIPGVSWAGYKFQTALPIRKIRFCTSYASESIISVKAQYSDDGIIWVDGATFNSLSTATENWNELELPYCGAHTHWRLLANASASYWYVMEMEMMTLVGRASENKCTGGTPIAISGSTGAVNAFDNNPATYWTAPYYVNPGCWLGYDFGKNVRVRTIVLVQEDYDNAPDGMVVEYSSDGTTWVIAVPEFWSSAGRLEISVPANSGYRYWRVSNTIYQSGFWYIYAMEMYTLQSGASYVTALL